MHIKHKHRLHVGRGERAEGGLQSLDRRPQRSARAKRPQRSVCGAFDQAAGRWEVRLHASVINYVERNLEVKLPNERAVKVRAEANASTS